MPQRVIFMGTPDFAVPSLKCLKDAYNVVAVVTQPDRRSGRGRKTVAPPVKQVAEAAQLPVIQPVTLRDPDVVSQLQSLRPDVIVVAAFGQILRSDILTMPEYGCINVHASLLPRWRGAAPVAAAIRAGDSETGVTIMQMDEGLDTGPMLRSRALAITPEHTRATLTDDLADLGADLLIETLPDWFASAITPQKQDDTFATLAPRIKKEAGQIDWTQSATEIERHVRAYDPWPGTFTFWDNKRLKILSVSVANEGPEHTLSPGRVFQLGDEIAVAVGEGSVMLQQVQLAGKRATSAKDLTRGAKAFVGSQL